MVNPEPRFAMKKTQTTLLLCALLAAMPAAVSAAAIASASFQASLTVTDACRVDADARAPVVQCQLATPFQLAPRALQAAQESAGTAPRWIVTF
jgi:hypothetical protein